MSAHLSMNPGRFGPRLFRSEAFRPESFRPILGWVVSCLEGGSFLPIFWVKRFGHVSQEISPGSTWIV